MKKILIGSLVVIMILAVQQIWAQRSPSGKIDHLKTELELTDDQVTELEKIFESKHEEIKALRSNDDQTKEEKHEAMQAFRQSMEKEIESVLDEDQLGKFQEIKKQRRNENGSRGKRKGFHHKFKDGKGKELHAQIKAYKDQNIKPVMLEQRAKLEPKISEADKLVIAEFRAEFEKMKAEHKARFEKKRGKGENRECTGNNEMERNRNHKFGEENREKMKNLVEKYKDDIDPLFAEVETQQEKWKKDIREITKNTLELKEEELDNRMKRMRNHHGDRMEMMRMSRFLLLDPNEKVNGPATQSLISEVVAFPNPATTVTTIEFDVLEEGQVLIELRSRKGKLLKTVKNEVLAKGKHSVTISLESYNSDLFYVVLKDKNDNTTTKNIVRVK